MVLPDILIPNKYPDINWSTKRTHANGDESFNYGLVNLRFQDKGYRMQESGILTPYYVPDRSDSMLAFGHPSIVQIQVFSNSENLFTLANPERINNVGIETRKLIVALHQRATALRVIGHAENLRRLLMWSVFWEDEDSSKDAGIIEEFIKRQKEQILPEKILEIAAKLKNLRIAKFTEGNGFQNGWDATPEWILEQFSKPEMQ